MYYIKLDNNLNRTIEKSIYIPFEYTKEDRFVCFIKNNNNDINQSYDIEKIVYKNNFLSYLYARYVAKGRFELGEQVISQDSWYSWIYARTILKGRFKLGEKAIAKDSYYSYFYAIDILKSRFYLGEPVIKNSDWRWKYENHFGIKL